MRKLVSFLFVVLFAASALFAAQPVSATSITPVLYENDNPTCAALGYAHNLKFDNLNGPYSGSLSYGGMVITSVSADGTYVDWSSTLGVDAVIVKGGNAANVYTYAPEATSDSGLVSPINASGGPAALSHVDFCYDFEVGVSKTAVTSYTRDWNWTIAKSASPTSLLLAAGQTFPVNYSVSVSPSYTDKDFAVSGAITITNPDPDYTATIVSVVDTLNGAVIPVSCPAMSIAPLGSLVCTYSTTLASKTDTTNYAAVTTSGMVGGGTAQAAVTFGAPAIENDRCVDVTDTMYGDLGRVCGETTFSYTKIFGSDVALVCGEQQITNIASFSAPSGASGSASAVVDVTVACGSGCTLTQGYWKTHSLSGPANYDDAWQLVGPSQEGTSFYLSGKSWLGVFWTAPAGNAYYNLAHQYMAAKLNQLNGASTTASVDAALASAEAFFATSTPATRLSKDVRMQVLTNALILDQYNNGLIGPGHCSE